MTPLAPGLFPGDAEAGFVKHVDPPVHKLPGAGQLAPPVFRVRRPEARHRLTDLVSELRRRARFETAAAGVAIFGTSRVELLPEAGESVEGVFAVPVSFVLAVLHRFPFRGPCVTLHDPGEGYHGR